MAQREAEVKNAQSGRRFFASKCKTEMRVAFRLGRRHAKWERFVLDFDEAETEKRCQALPNVESEEEAKRWAFETWESRYKTA